MSKRPCELPPCAPCPPPPPQPCPQVCPPPPPKPPCRSKPIMRGLHWSQTKVNLASALSLSALAGLGIVVFVKRPRREKYKDYYAKAEFEEYADEMARKGLFQSVPKESLQNN